MQWNNLAYATRLSCLALVPGTALTMAHAADLGAVKPVMECADLLKVDFTSLNDAPTRLNAATVVNQGTAPPYCSVTGYVASQVNFEVRLPISGWTQRFLMRGPGGYGGVVNLTFGAGDAAVGSPRVLSGELAVASHDTGHQLARNKIGGDGLWALGNPGAVVDFTYKASHKVTVAAKALIETFYGQPARYSYFTGSSNGGRAGLAEAQRYPDDYDGILSGAPTIDYIATNTFYHSWVIRHNTRPDGHPILTADKIPALAAAVLRACADNSGMIQDPRTCDFDAKALLCKTVDDPSCLTPEQATVANLFYQGPVDEKGNRLTSGLFPYGSELAWIGNQAQSADQLTSRSGEAGWSDDFPSYMSNFENTGINNRNIRFTEEEFEFFHRFQGLYDPTNPDLRAFSRAGGKLMMWIGWADSGTSPFGALNYYDAVRKFMGAQAAGEFMALYMLPGVYHSAGGPKGANIDFLSALIRWAEDGVRPDKVVVGYRNGPTLDAPVPRMRPVFPYPSIAAYTGQGDVNDAANYVRSQAAQNLNDTYEWLGLKNYRPGQQVSCEQNGLSFVCGKAARF
jgi:Tannase and feruloyl esterase